MVQGARRDRAVQELHSLIWARQVQQDQVDRQIPAALSVRPDRLVPPLRLDQPVHWVPEVLIFLGVQELHLVRTVPADRTVQLVLARLCFLVDQQARVFLKMKLIISLLLFPITDNF